MRAAPFQDIQEVKSFAKPPPLVEASVLTQILTVCLQAFLHDARSECQPVEVVLSAVCLLMGLNLGTACFYQFCFRKR